MLSMQEEETFLDHATGNETRDLRISIINDALPTEILLLLHTYQKTRKGDVTRDDF